MADKKLVDKLAKVPLAQPGFDALGISAPVIVQLNPEGKWSNKKPDGLEEERLRAVVQHLVNSKAISAAQSYCCQCAQDNKNTGLNSNPNYVPVIMMPIFPADQCPFDMECEVQKMREMQTKPTKKTKTAEDTKDSDDKEKDKSKPKKRGFVMQRLTNFDLLSQW